MPRPTLHRGYVSLGQNEEETAAATAAMTGGIATILSAVGLVIELVDGIKARRRAAEEAFTAIWPYFPPTAQQDHAYWLFRYEHRDWLNGTERGRELRQFREHWVNAYANTYSDDDIRAGAAQRGPEFGLFPGADAAAEQQSAALQARTEVLTMRLLQAGWTATPYGSTVPAGVSPAWPTKADLQPIRNMRGAVPWDLELSLWPQLKAKRQAEERAADTGANIVGNGAVSIVGYLLQQGAITNAEMQTALGVVMASMTNSIGSLTPEQTALYERIKPSLAAEASAVQQIVDTAVATAETEAAAADAEIARREQIAATTAEAVTTGTIPLEQVEVTASALDKATSGTDQPLTEAETAALAAVTPTLEKMSQNESKASMKKLALPAAVAAGAAYFMM